MFFFFLSKCPCERKLVEANACDLTVTLTAKHGRRSFCGSSMLVSVAEGGALKCDISHLPNSDALLGSEAAAKQTISLALGGF